MQSLDTEHEKRIEKQEDAEDESSQEDVNLDDYEELLKSHK